MKKPSFSYKKEQFFLFLVHFSVFICPSSCKSAILVV